MITAVCAVAIAQAQSGLLYSADRFDMGERLRRLDVAWLDTQDEARRAAAVPLIGRAVTAFFTQQYSGACRSLDQATAALEGREVRPEDAITLRTDPPYAEPNSSARIRLSWAYEPASAISLEARSSGAEVRVEPGRTALLEVDPRVSNPALRVEPELGVLLPVQVGERRAQTYLSVAKDLPGRTGVLAKSESQAVRQIGAFLRQYLDGEAEFDAPLIDWLFAAESIERGDESLETLRDVPHAMSGQTALRAAFPDEPTKPTTVVIALHGAGGTESMFLEAYGRGRAMTAALARGWAFVSPRASRTALDDSMTWLKEVRKLEPDRVFVIGHSMGGGLALLEPESEFRPTALALFAPAGGLVPESMRSMPIYLAIGESDLPMLMNSARQIADQMSGRSEFAFRTYPRCGHLMVVAEAVEDAYRFFEGALRGRVGADGRW